MIVLWIVVAVLSVLVLVCVLALIDQYRTLELIRSKLKLEDNPEPIPLPNGSFIRPSSIGLPDSLDDKRHLVVLFLSTSCTTCRTIAQSMKPYAWANVWVVLEHAHDHGEAVDWLSTSGVPLDRVTVDLDGSVAAAIGISVTPAALLYRHGEILIAQTVPSFRQFTPLLDEKTQSKLVSLADERQGQS